MSREEGNHYLIGIDETGNFDDVNYEEKSRVGGIVWVNYRREDVKKIVENICYQHQQPELAQELHLLHYYDAKSHGIELKISKKNENGVQAEAKNITISQQESMRIVQDVVQDIQSRCKMFFISSGFPNFVAEEQHAYIELLRTTLWGLLKDKLNLQPKDHVLVSIATRDYAGGKFGKWEVHNDQYYNFIATQLGKEFAVIKKEKELQSLKFEFGKPKGNHVELILADLVLGNYRLRKDKGNIKQYYVDTEYCVIHHSDYFKYLMGEREVEDLVSDCEHGKCPIIPTIFTLLYLYVTEQNSSSQSNIEKNIKKLLQKLNAQEHLQQAFLKTLDSEFQSLMSNRVHDERSLSIAIKYCDICDAMLNRANTAENSIFFLRIQEIIYRYRITISSHKGGVGMKGVIESYEQFFDKAKENLYPTMAERVKSFLDTELQSVQVGCFNSYDFETVQKHYSDYENGYRKMCKGYQAKPESLFAKACGRKDSLLGKLCGTLGQAYSFLYAIHQKDEDYEWGKSLLKDDTDNFVPGTLDWCQGMDYRIHLELCKGNLDDAFDLLKEEFHSSDLTPDSLIFYLLKKQNIPCSVWNISIAIKFLGYYKHSHPDFQISQENLHNLLDMIQDDWGIYPKCNILKWMAYLAVNTENKANLQLSNGSQDIAKQALAKIDHSLFDTKEFTIKTLQIPILLLSTWAKSEHPKKNLEILDQLMEQQPCFKDCMEHYHWQEKFSKQSTNNWNLWDIVTMLPFYYS